jgi:tungstate transport system ATP-binding protein
MPTNLLEIKDLVVRHDKRMVLNVPALEVVEGQVLAVIGPNGAGKSTLLLAMARLLKPDSGQVLLRGQPITPHHELEYRRRIALVLQESLLLDDTVFNNLAIGLRLHGLPRSEIDRRVNHWLERLGIAPLARRKARTLSGGEAQRTSLGRAFALQPDLLLLDEPFSALDAPTRQALLEELQALLAETHQTAVFVTHDLDEALMLGQQVAVLLAGNLRQVGEPRQVFSEPADPEVAAFVGVETVLPGRVTGQADGLVQLDLDSALTGAVGMTAVGQAATGRAVYLCLRPEDITLWPAGDVPASSARNRLKGRITRLAPQGALVRVTVDCGLPLVALVTRPSAREMGLEPGLEVAASFKASAAHLILR